MDFLYHPIGRTLCLELRALFRVNPTVATALQICCLGRCCELKSATTTRHGDLGRIRMQVVNPSFWSQA